MNPPTKPTPPATPLAVDLADPDWFDAKAKEYESYGALTAYGQDVNRRYLATAAELRSLRAKLADAERERDENANAVLTSANAQVALLHRSEAAEKSRDFYFSRMELMEGQLATAEAALAERDADSRRLDWIDNHPEQVRYDPHWGAWYAVGNERQYNECRAAIDAGLAREAQKAP